MRPVSYTHLDVYKRQFLFAAGHAWPFLLEAVCVSLAIVLISRIARTPVPPRGEGVSGRAKVHTCLLYTSRCV